MLFQRLPDEIFRPLAGPNRALFEEVLRFLYDYLNNEDLLLDATFLPRRTVIKEIEEFLAQKDRLLSIVNEEAEETVAAQETPNGAARYLYQRLVKTGWLEQEEDNYEVYVVMPPYANSLLEALVGIALAEKKNYGSTVSSINIQLEAILSSPSKNAHAFLEVVKSAKDFTHHLQNIVTGIRGFQETISRHDAPQKVMATFFEDFVESILISDYTSLQEENNPFRHRSSVLNHLQFIKYDNKTLTILAQLYQEERGIQESEARAKVLDDIDRISRVFQSVDRRLSAIDHYRKRLESRVSEMIRYLDRASPDFINRGIETLTRFDERAKEPIVVQPPTPPTWLSVNYISMNSLRFPKKRREQKHVLLKPQVAISDEARAEKQRMREYLNRRSVSVEKVTHYIDNQMSDQTLMTAAEFKVETIEDLVSFVFIPYLSQITPTGREKHAPFSIRKTGGRVETPWMECADFIVERVQKC